MKNLNLKIEKKKINKKKMLEEDCVCKKDEELYEYKDVCVHLFFLSLGENRILGQLWRKSKEEISSEIVFSNNKKKIQAQI